LNGDKWNKLTATDAVALLKNLEFYSDCDALLKAHAARHRRWALV